MSEHGWPDFHDDHGDHGDHGDGHDAGLHHDDALAPDDIHDVHDVGAHDTDDDSGPWHDEPAEVHDDTPYEHHPEEVAGEPEDQPWTAPEHDLGPVGADPDALPDVAADLDVFPQVIDVGPLPEPVDGLPWIDTGSLGVIDAHAVEAHDAGVTPQELAEYAGADLPPGADPWAALADSEDPATSALARWWSEQQQ